MSNNKKKRAKLKHEPDFEANRATRFPTSPRDVPPVASLPNNQHGLATPSVEHGAPTRTTSVLRSAAGYFFGVVFNEVAACVAPVLSLPSRTLHQAAATNPTSVNGPFHNVANEGGSETFQPGLQREQQNESHGQEEAPPVYESQPSLQREQGINAHGQEAKRAAKRQTKRPALYSEGVAKVFVVKGGAYHRYVRKGKFFFKGKIPTGKVGYNKRTPYCQLCFSNCINDKKYTCTHHQM